MLGNGYALIGLSVDPTEGMSETFKQFLKQLGCQFITLYPYAERPQAHTARNLNPDVLEVEDIEGNMVNWLIKSGQDKPVALLRPDRFTFAVSRQVEINAVIQQLQQQLGLGGCASFDIVTILKKSRQNVTNVVCQLKADRADTIPSVFTKIHLHFVVTWHDVKEKQVAKAVELSAESIAQQVKCCPMAVLKSPMILKLFPRNN